MTGNKLLGKEFMMASHCPPELMLFQVRPCQSSTGVRYWMANKERAVHPHREGFRQTAQGREALSDVPHALHHSSKPQTTSHRHTCTDCLKQRHFVRKKLAWEEENEGHSWSQWTVAVWSEGWQMLVLMRVLRRPLFSSLRSRTPFFAEAVHTWQGNRES